MGTPNIIQAVLNSMIDKGISPEKAKEALENPRCELDAEFRLWAIWAVTTIMELQKK